MKRLTGTKYSKERSTCLKNKNIFIASHISDLEGPTEALLDYLRRKNCQFKAILFPLHYCIDKRPKIVQRNEVRNLDFWGLKLNLVLSCVRDIILCFWYGAKNSEKKQTMFIGVDPLNCFVGLILRKLGRVQKVVFYSIDWTNKRFESKILNSIYHKIDKFCSINSDENWNISNMIDSVRIQYTGLNHVNKVVPVGAPSLSRKAYCFSSQRNVVLLGALAPSKGVDLVIEAWPSVIREVASARLHVIGKTPENRMENGVRYEEYEERLRRLGDSVVLHGRIPRTKVYKLLTQMHLALALYKPTTDNLSLWADPSRVKDYLAAGLPVLITEVPSIAREIDLYDCGRIVSYERDDLYKNIVAYLTSEALIRSQGKNATSYMERFDWDYIFDAAFALN